MTYDPTKDAQHEIISDLDVKIARLEDEATILQQALEISNHKLFQLKAMRQKILRNAKWNKKAS